jgi:hypothetical protein
MQELNILDGDAAFTISMAQAETDAKKFSEKCRLKAHDGLTKLGRVLQSVITHPKKIVTSEKVRGVVVKFDTKKLMSNYQVLEFGDEIRVSTEVIQSVMMYVSGFYEVVDIEELEPGDLYAW